MSDIRKDLVKMKLAHKITEVFSALVHGQEKDKKLWDLLRSSLEKINDSDLKISGLRLRYYYFVWNLFSIMGYLPELYQCSPCRKKLQPGNLYFNAEGEGVICEGCFSKKREGKKISANAVKILRVLTEGKESLMERIKINPVDLKELQTITEYFLENNLPSKKD